MLIGASCPSRTDEQAGDQRQILNFIEFQGGFAAVANGGSHSEEISLLTPENCAATYETETTAVDVRQILGVRERYKEALKFLEATARSNANTRAPWCEARSV